MWNIVIQSLNTNRVQHQIEAGVTLLGRKENCAIVLDHSSVSRVHAKLEYNLDTDTLTLQDMGSTNGTYLNTKRVIEVETLAHSDQIRIGKFLISIHGQAVKDAEVQSISSEDTDSFGEILIQAVDQYAVLLHDLSNQLVVISELNEAIDLLNNFVLRMLGADQSVLYFPGQIPEFLETLTAQESVLNCIETKIPVAFKSKEQHPEKGEVHVSNIVVPVLVDHTIFALIHVVSRSVEQFEESDLQLVVAVSHQAALTLQRLDFEEKLVHNALHDPVTSLPNRVSLLKALEFAIARAGRNPDEGFALFFIDIDNFKLINDSLGHVVGDKVLAAIAKRLNQACREVDLIVRFGGDEFAILYETDADVPELTMIAQRMIERVTEPYQIEGHEIVLRISMGITVSSLGYQIPEEVIRDADIAMYQAKAIEDIHMKFFDKSMHLELVNLLQMQNKLREAHKRGDFVLEYQPIINIASGQIVGMEALLRWDKPGEGLLTPDKFLSSMDTTGLLSSVEGWVIQTACSQLAWVNQNLKLEHPIFLSINLSEKQLRQPNLFELVQTGLELNNIEPNLLWLEITEQSDLKNMEAASSIFESFRTMGVRMCLDDFGTGYSTLSYLNSFPLDVLKIDKSFVQDVNTRPEREKLVKAIIGLGKNLGLAVVAEGVETAEQLVFLRQTDCDYAQGFLISKSLSVDAFEKLLKSNSSW